MLQPAELLPLLDTLDHLLAVEVSRWEDAAVQRYLVDDEVYDVWNGYL